MRASEWVYPWRQFTLREGLLLGFCATFIILARGGLRLHLHLPGHVMFFTMFFFLLARGCVPKIGATTLVGLIVSLASVLLGMGTKGPMVFVKFLLPALLVDLAGIVYPAFVNCMLACALVGAGRKPGSRSRSRMQVSRAQWRCSKMVNEWLRPK